jgi:hypothetical protein
VEHREPAVVAAAHVRQPDASSDSSSARHRPRSTASSAMRECTIRSACIPPHQSLSGGVAKHQALAEAATSVRPAA